MSEYTICENGHNYSKNLAECPYCPKKGDFSGGLSGSLGKTRVEDFEDFDMSSFGFDNPQNNMGRTQVFGGGGMSPEFDFGAQQTNPRQQGRKMVGWLVSFTIEAGGRDYRLYEGRNLVGSDSACDIVVPDPSVSGKHLTILHRMGHFKFRDEFSTNGTFINDIFEEEGNLKDGDMIRIGETIFKFRSIA